MGKRTYTIIGLLGMVVVVVVFALGSTFAQTHSTTQAESSKAAVVILQGEIDDYSHDSLIRHFNDARAAGARTIILQLDTYGGSVVSGLEISQFIKQQTDVHVIAYIPRKAISAGAMIAMACDEIVMKPEAIIGDSRTDRFQFQRRSRITPRCRAAASRKCRSARTLKTPQDATATARCWPTRWCRSARSCMTSNLPTARGDSSTRPISISSPRPAGKPSMACPTRSMAPNNCSRCTPIWPRKSVCANKSKTRRIRSHLRGRTTSSPPSAHPPAKTSSNSSAPPLCADCSSRSSSSASRSRSGAWAWRG